jgi:hypothetical protein
LLAGSVGTAYAVDRRHRAVAHHTLSGADS